MQKPAAARRRVKSGAEDHGIAAHLGRLETMRQGAVARNALLQEGATQGGGAVGGVGGALSGGAAGAVGASRMLGKTKMPVRGKLGIGTIISLLGALGGAVGGRKGGQAVGGYAVGKLPGHMESPVDVATAPQVTGTLAKMSGVNLNLVQARLKKQANAANLLRGGMKMFGQVAKTPFKRPLTTAAIGAGGAVGGGHMYNQAQNTVGRTANPFTWVNPQSHQDVFQRNLDQYNTMAGGQHKAIADAYGSGNFAKADQLQEQLQSGEFGGRNNVFSPNPRLWGLNPFSQGPAANPLGQALDIQGGDQGRLDRLQQYMQTHGASMPPAARQQLDAQMGQLRKRLAVKLPGGQAQPATGNAQFLGNRPPGANIAQWVDPNQAIDRYQALINQGGGFNG